MTRRIKGVTGAAVLAVFGNLAFWHGAYAGATPVSCDVSSLVNAINQANLASSPATLSLSTKCVYALTSPDNTLDGGNGLPLITGHVTIVGNHATIKRYSTSSAPAPPFRIFDVAQGASLTLHSLILSGGLLSKTDTNGGGAIDNNGTLSLTGVNLSRNNAPSVSGASGGAIQNGEYAHLTVNRGSFSGDKAFEGGAIFNQGSATITSVTFSKNSASGSGGGAVANVSVSSSVVLATMDVSGSTFTGNKAAAGGGGAIDNDTTISVENSSFSANTAGSNGGGAINNFGFAQITQTTFSGNGSLYGDSLHTYCDAQQAATGTCETTVAMSVLAAGVNGANCASNFTAPPPVTDGGYNLDDGATCGFTAATGSLINVAPMLGPLQKNGGPTMTMALSAGSPAIDVIPTSTPGCTGSLDQRLVKRPQGVGCDMGSYETKNS
jgi:predicted outer membrane repeat protein